MPKCHADFRVRCYEQDFKGRMRPTAIFNWLQDAAGKHCLKYGVAIENIIPKGYTWVIHRYRVVIHKSPVYTQKCKLTTWAYPKRDLISVRDYSIESETGEKLISATSEWALLSTKTMALEKLSTVLSDMPVCTDRELEGGRSIKIPAELSPAKTVECVAPAWSLDGNRHINNAAYITFAYESVFPEVTDNYRLKEIEVNYKKQGYYGQRIASKAFKVNEAEYLHSIELAETGEQLALLKTVWEKES